MANLLKKFLLKIRYFKDGRILKIHQVKIKKKWFGNSYGGFYLNTKDLNSKSIVYSIGIGTDASFDLELINTFNCQIYGFDPTPKSIRWVKENIDSRKFKMSEFGISSFSGKKRILPSKNQNHVSGSLISIKTVDKKDSIFLEFKTLDEAMKSNNHKYLDLLKMDIEGAEYDVIENILNKSIKINQIVVEFHPHLIKNGRKKTQDIILKLNQKGFKCFGISDTFLEYSFLKA